MLKKSQQNDKSPKRKGRLLHGWCWCWYTADMCREVIGSVSGPRKPKKPEKVSGYRIGDLQFSGSRLGQFGLPGIRLKKFKKAKKY